MSKITTDMQDKILAEIDAGLSTQAAAAKYKVARSNIYAWRSRKKLGRRGIIMAPRSARPITQEGHEIYDLRKRLADAERMIGRQAIELDRLKSR